MSNKESQMKQFDEVRAFAPASVSNVTCGFDILGFALEEPGDVVVARRLPNEPKELRIAKITGDEGRLPYRVADNTAGRAVQVMLEEVDVIDGIELEIHKKMPLGSGLGSSAASAVAAVVAVNRLLGEPFERRKLLDFALLGEYVASGDIHPDNVTPSLYGGVTLIRSVDPPDVIPLKLPKPLHCAVLHPHVEIATNEMRRRLPENVPLKKAVRHWGNVAGLVASLLQGDYELLARSLKDDIVEPVRAPFIPEFDAIKAAALDAGAIGAGISGSGPSIFALCEAAGQAKKVGAAMCDVIKAAGVEHTLYLSDVNSAGPNIIEERKLENKTIPDKP